MVTEDGAIKVQTKIDGKVFKQFSKKYFIIWWVVFSLSLAIIASEVAFAFLYKDIFDIIVLICSVVLFAGSLFIIISMSLAIKKANKKDYYNVCCFYSEYMLVEQFENGSKISEAQIYYHTLIKFTELKDYYIAFISKNAFHPVDKNGLTPEESATIKNLLRLAGTTPTPAYNTQPPQYVPFNKNKSVFEDFPDNDENNKGGQG